MRYIHKIETTDSPTDDIWQTVIIGGDTSDEHNGTAADYGRDVLSQWIADEQLTDAQLADIDGNAKIRVVVRIDDGEDEDPPVAAVTEYGCAPDPVTEAVDEARAHVLHASASRSHALDTLGEALRVARARGDGANVLADRAAPAVSRPTALRMMREE